MGGNLFNKDYNEYISALKKLVEAQNKAREYGALFPLQPGEESPDLTLKGKKAFQRLNKAYEVYVKKYKAWRDFLKTHEL